VRSMGALVFGVILLAVGACGGGSASSAAPASAVPSVTAALTPASSIDGVALATAVVARLQADPFIAHVEQIEDGEILEATEGSLPKGAKIHAKDSYDINGDDMRALMTASVGGGQATEYEIVALGDTVWVRQGAGELVSQPRSATLQAALQQAFDPIYKSLRITDDPSVLRYVGLELIDGRELHRLTAVRGVVPYTMGPNAPGTYNMAAYDNLDLYVLDDGTPVLAKGTFTGKGSLGELTSGTNTTAFSNVGGPVTIVEPGSSAAAVAPSPAVAPPTRGTAAEDWQNFSGEGYRIGHPSDWHPASVPPNVDRLISPTSYPFLEITVLCAPETATCTYSPADLAGIWGFPTDDAQRSETTVDGESAVVVRFHNTGDTGIRYYRLQAFVVHAGFAYRLELIAKAGGEQAADALLTRFLASFAFTST